MYTFLQHLASELTNLIQFLSLFTNSFWVYPFVLFFFTILFFKLISRRW